MNTDDWYLIIIENYLSKTFHYQTTMRVYQRTAYFLNTWVRRQVIFPLLYFTILTGWFTWPLASHLTGSIIGWPGDNFYYVWLVGWFQKAFFTLHINPFTVPFHNYPSGWSLAYTETTLSNVLLALPFSLVGGPTFGYNLAVIFSYILSGWFVYLWCVTLFKNRSAAIVAGTIFAFAPYRLAHSMGHLPLMGTQWLALYFFGLTMALKKPSWEWKTLIAGGIGLGMLSLSSMYYLYMSLIVSALVLIGYFFFIRHRAVFEIQFWKKLLAIAVISLPFIVIALWPYVQLADQGNANSRTLAEVDGWSASITDFFLPSPTHFLWGKWVTEHINRPLWVEQYIYLGAIPVLLILAAVFIPEKNAERQNIGQQFSDQQQKPYTSWMFFLLAGCVILAMGTTLHWLGKPVIISYPEFIQKSYILSNGRIPLPNYFFFRFLPFYDGMRVWSRYGGYAVLFASILAGAGLARLYERLHCRSLQYAAVIAIVVLICIDFRIDVPLASTEPRPLDVWLNTAPEAGSVVEFPISASSSPQYILGSLKHEKPLFGMFYGAYFPKEFNDLLPVLDTFPSEESIQILRERRVGYVIVNLNQYKDWNRERIAKPAAGLTLLQKIDPYCVYRIDNPQQARLLEAIQK